MNFWNTRLNAIKQKFELRSELELAILLRMHPAALGHIRSNARPPSTSNAVRILDKSGYALTKTVFIKVLPNSIQSAVSKAERSRALEMGMADLQTQDWVLQAHDAEGRVPKIDWISALDQLKIKENLKTDVMLAKVLEINAPAVAQIRKGKRLLPVAAKINLLAGLGVNLDEETLLLSMSEDLQSAVMDSSSKGLVKVPSGTQDPNVGFDMDIPMTSA